MVSRLSEFAVLQSRSNVANGLSSPAGHGVRQRGRAGQRGDDLVPVCSDDGAGPAPMSEIIDRPAPVGATCMHEPFLTVADDDNGDTVFKGSCADHDRALKHDL